MENEEKALVQQKPKEVGSVFASEKGYANALEAAKTLASSELVPQAYRSKPANCLIAIDISRQVKSSPLIVMQNLHIIKGKPSWSSTYIAGAIKSRYKNTRVIMDGEGDNRGCRVVAYDDKGEVIAEGARVSIAMAKAEGWFSKKDKYGKESSKWQTMPELMLQYRANAFFGRVHCPDVLIGLHSEHEAQDVEIEEITEIVDPLSNKVPTEEVPETTQEEPQIDDTIIESLVCTSCGTEVSDKVREYSKSKYGTILCYPCQKKVGE